MRDSVNISNVTFCLGVVILHSFRPKGKEHYGKHSAGVKTTVNGAAGYHPGVYIKMRHGS